MQKSLIVKIQSGFFYGAVLVAFYAVTLMAYLKVAQIGQ